jgi:redox-sensitive bicupin YhaK (pirin superfamily)
MVTLRKAKDRGSFDFGWLDTRHTFSFGEYNDPAHMGFRSLRVLNEDRVKPGMGFGTHGHRDMEILTWVVDGTLEHKDSLGTVGILTPGIMQRMSAGTGIRHSEYNGSKTEPVHFYQIWIVPGKQGAAPAYEDRLFSAEGRRNKLQLLASPDGAEGSLILQQDARAYAVDLDAGAEVTLELPPGRHAWVQAVRGQVDIALSGDAKALEPLSEGDGAAVSGEKRLTLKSKDGGQALLFDLA